ncbi:MAG: CRISPR-associated endonuclease Cas1 [Methylobacter sp.]|jgi:CRISPR-associated protein Cas1|nr:CRISPR-associated endonuclease Cas1 [Methylobacter sp.]
MQKAQLSDALTDLNLHQAWSKVYENQGCAGADYQTLEAFAERLHKNLETLRDEVNYETYQPRPMLRIDLEKPGGGKRLLSIPTVRDRVLQTAVTRVIEPLFEAEFEDCSFAYRKGRSVDQALERIQLLQRQGYHWVVDADIQCFFDSIDHTLLMTMVGKLITDAGLLRLIEQWLCTTVVDGDRRFVLHKGVAQGSPIAPLLSNLYLDHLDEALLDNNLCMVRFADDFLILCKSRDHAEQALELTDSLLGQLRLTLNTRKTQIVHFNQGFRFLGVQFIRSLAFKTEADEPNLLALPVSDERTDAGSTSFRQGLPESRRHGRHLDSIGPNGDQKTAEPLSIMQLAFSAANLDAKDFSAREQPLDTLERPDEQDLPTDHEPLLRTLYLLQHGQVLGKESERLIVRQEQKTVREIPAIKVDQIMVFGNAQITTQAMQFCLQERIPIYLLSGQGHYYGVIDSFNTEPVLLQREQFLRANDGAFCLKLAAAMVHGKIANSRLMLQRQARRHDTADLHTAADALKNTLAHLSGASTLDELRGFEGSAAKAYFQALAATVDSSWGFSQRVRQPPTDGINAMLSYGYTLLFYNIYSLLRSRGLNPQVGFLHALRQGHPALASDMVEEFRAIVVDAVVWKLVLNQQLTPDDFDYPKTAGEGCFLKPHARQLFIKALEEKLNSAIAHPVSGTQLDYRRCMEYQVQHLSQVIRGIDANYQAMVLR